MTSRGVYVLCREWDAVKVTLQYPPRIQDRVCRRTAERGRNVFPIRARGEKIMFPAMTSGISLALIFRRISRTTDRRRLGAPLHPLRQPAAVVLQQKRSHAEALTDDAARFGIAR